MSILKAGRPVNLKEKALAAVQDDIQKISKVTVNFPKELHKRVKQFALNEDTTITEVLIKAVEKYISQK